MFREFQVDAPESGRHLADVLGVETLDEWEVVIVHHHLLVIDDVVVQLPDGKQGARGLQLNR